MIDMAIKESYIKKEWDFLKVSFRLDRRFWYVLLLELALIFLIFLGYYVLSFNLNEMAGELAGVTQSLSSQSQLTDVLLLEGLKSDLQSFYTTVVAYIALFVVFAMLVWTAVKSFIYVVVNRTRCSMALYWRFILACIVWSAVFITLMLLVQYLLGLLMWKVSVTNMAGQFFIVLVNTFFVLLLFYLTVVLFTELTLSVDMRGASVMFWRKGLKTVRHALLPVVFQLLMFIVINILMYFLVRLPSQLFVILTAFILLSYFVWLRFYNTQVWYGLKGDADVPERAAGGRVVSVKRAGPRGGKKRAASKKDKSERGKGKSKKKTKGTRKKTKKSKTKKK